jgi:NADPH:quinone reductase
MKAIIIEQFGNPETFKEVDLATPDILSHHVLIQVVATSVNPVDYKIRQGVVADIAPNFPAILHGDVAGTRTYALTGVQKCGEFR